jgi:addiction module HigA family antidote
MRSWSTIWIITEDMTMTRMHNPPHPGEVLQDGVLGGDLTVTEFAKRLRVSRVALSRVLNGHAAVSAELAIRLAAALGGSPESWLSMQAAYDLWHAGKKRRPKIQKIERAHLERATAA